VIAGVILVAGIYLLSDWIITTDRERVEDLVERMFAVAREGGEDATATCLDALADDFRGAGVFGRESIAAHLDRYVTARRVRSLERGGYETIWVGDEIHVPFVRLDADAGNLKGTMFLKLAFAERDGQWKLVDVTRWRPR